MKKLLILFIIAIFTIPVNAQQDLLNMQKLKSAKKKIGLGATFTMVGVGGMIGGAVIYVNGLNGIENSTTDQDIESNLGTGLGGLAILVVGEILFDIGLPFWIVGSVQKRHAERNLELGMVQFRAPNIHTPINGIGLTIRF